MTVPMERVANRILSIRGHRVMVDMDLAEVYGVQTKWLNEQVKWNAGRFPEDFAFRITMEEKLELVAKCDRFSRLIRPLFLLPSRNTVRSWPPIS